MLFPSLFILRLNRKGFPLLKDLRDQMFHKYLLLTNMGISGVLSLTGDLLQQNYEKIKRRDREWDAPRSMRMMASGVAVGFFCHHFYSILDRTLPGKSIKTVMKKVLIDQFICSPVYIGVFLATTCYMEKKNMDEFKDELIHKGWRLFVADCMVWPPAQIINFYFLPPRYRVLYDNLISLGCDVYTSYVKNE